MQPLLAADSVIGGAESAHIDEQLADFSGSDYAFAASLPSSYRLLGVIGRGGMGVVYKGYDLGLDRPVAIKVLQAVGDATSLLRLKAEAQALADVAHPHIVAVLKMETLSGQCALVMEYVDGESLEAIIDKRGPLQPSVCRQILRQVAAALEAAHARGIVHRDLKPANILITEFGERLQVKVVDFGIARFVDGEGQRLTRTGAIVGSPEYISPEVCRGEQADSRSDIYSLGIVGFTMLAGTAPFNAESAIELLLMHVEQRVPEAPCPSDPALVQLIAKCTDPTPETRFQSAGELLSAESDPTFRHDTNNSAGGRRRARAASVATTVVVVLVVCWTVACALMSSRNAHHPSGVPRSAEEAWFQLEHLCAVHGDVPASIFAEVERLPEIDWPSTKPASRQPNHMTDADRHETIADAYATAAQRASIPEQARKYALRCYHHADLAIKLRCGSEFCNEEVAHMARGFLGAPNRSDEDLVLRAIQGQRELTINAERGALEDHKVLTKDDKESRDLNLNELDLMTIGVAIAAHDELLKASTLGTLRKRLREEDTQGFDVDEWIRRISWELGGGVPGTRVDKFVCDMRERYPDFPFGERQK